MTYGLDTSVVLRIVTGEPAALADKVDERIGELLDLGETFFIGNLACEESYFALQHHYGKTKQEAMSSTACNQTATRRMNEMIQFDGKAWRF